MSKVLFRLHASVTYFTPHLGIGTSSIISISLVYDERGNTEICQMMQQTRQDLQSFLTVSYWSMNHISTALIYFYQSTFFLFVLRSDVWPYFLQHFMAFIALSYSSASISSHLLYTPPNPTLL